MKRYEHKVVPIDIEKAIGRPTNFGRTGYWDPHMEENLDECGWRIVHVAKRDGFQVLVMLEREVVT